MFHLACVASTSLSTASGRGSAARLADAFGYPDRHETRVREGLDPAAGARAFGLTFERPCRIRVAGLPCTGDLRHPGQDRGGGGAAEQLRGRNLNRTLAPVGSTVAGSGRHSGRNRVSLRLLVHVSSVMRPLAVWCRPCGNPRTPDGARHGASATLGGRLGCIKPRHRARGYPAEAVSSQGPPRISPPSASIKH
jgi:hypothetical protein